MYEALREGAETRVHVNIDERGVVTGNGDPLKDGQYTVYFEDESDPVGDFTVEGGEASRASRRASDLFGGAVLVIEVISLGMSSSTWAEYVEDNLSMLGSVKALLAEEACPNCGKVHRPPEGMEPAQLGQYWTEQAVPYFNGVATTLASLAENGEADCTSEGCDEQHDLDWYGFDDKAAAAALLEKVQALQAFELPA